MALRHTASEIFAITIALFLLLPVLSAEPLPPELEESYADFRAVAEKEVGSLISPRSYSLENLTMVMREMTYHDAGILTKENSELYRTYGERTDIKILTTPQIAKEYLMRNVIDPLMKNMSITLETGEVISFENYSEEAMTELLFYYVRDHIGMMGPEDVPEEDRWQAQMPGVGRFVVSREKVVQFPAETVSIGKGGVCYDKALLLGTLLKVMGYDVAYGYYVSMALVVGPLKLRLPGGYHSYVLVKSDRGEWTVKGEKDMNGNDMSGRWMVLDPLYSPSYAPQMQMVGEHRAIGFGETPPWAEGLIEQQKGKVIPSELAFKI